MFTWIKKKKSKAALELDNFRTEVESAVIHDYPTWSRYYERYEKYSENPVYWKEYEAVRALQGAVYKKSGELIKRLNRQLDHMRDVVWHG